MRLLLWRVAGACAALTSAHAGLALVVAPLALRRLLHHQNHLHHLLQHPPQHVLLHHMRRWNLLQLVLLRRRLKLAAIVAGCVARPITTGGAQRCAAPSNCSWLVLILQPLWLCLALRMRTAVA